MQSSSLNDPSAGPHSYTPTHTPELAPGTLLSTPVVPQAPGSVSSAHTVQLTPSATHMVPEVDSRGPSPDGAPSHSVDTTGAPGMASTASEGSFGAPETNSAAVPGPPLHAIGAPAPPSSTRTPGVNVQPSFPSAPVQPAPFPVPVPDSTTDTRAAGDKPLLAQMEDLATHASHRYQRLLDASTPHKKERWIGFTVLLFLFLLRIFVLHAFYIVCYVLFIFLLNQFILFLQPKDYSNLVDSNTDEPTLPTQKLEEFRPFVRRLPEFKFWLAVSKGTCMAIMATFSPIFDVPVFWPILVMYFIILFVATMRRQFMDMKRFKYVPWDIGRKKKYTSNVSVTK